MYDLTSTIQVKYVYVQWRRQNINVVDDRFYAAFLVGVVHMFDDVYYMYMAIYYEKYLVSSRLTHLYSLMIHVHSLTNYHLRVYEGKYGIYIFVYVRDILGGERDVI